jgi:GTP1/Obg family GTP-binding protein
MAKRTQQQNGRLEEALAALIQAQATLTQTQASFLSRLSQVEQEAAQRFLSVESILSDHSRSLQELRKMIEDLSRVQAVDERPTP